MPKIDFKKELKHLYNPPAKKFSMVDVPPLNFLMLDGRGNPNTAPAYQEALEALYAVSFTLKFMVKQSEAAVDYVVMPLEGLWWTDDMRQFSLDNKDLWQWTAMIMQPEFVTAELLAAALKQVERKKNPPALSKIRLEPFHEGLAVQIKYFGPYADEGPTIAAMHQFIADNGYRLTGKHHEIYLSDPRRTAPERLKTVIRQPVHPRED